MTQVAQGAARGQPGRGRAHLEINRVEYIVRGVGQIEDMEDIEQTVVVERDGTPTPRRASSARVGLGPAARRGALDVGGAEAVGGVVVARYGENPVEVIEQHQGQDRSSSRQACPQRTLPDGRVSQVTVVPFYDRIGGGRGDAWTRCPRRSFSRS